MSRVVASPIPITSKPVRDRLDAVKAEVSRTYQVTLGRDATWNEVMVRLLDTHDQALAEIAKLRAQLKEGKRNDQDHG